MARVKQTEDELLGHLKSQLGFLERSAESYDKGFEDEAKRLAVVIRVLVHDTSQSASLLMLLNKKNIKFYDSTAPYHPHSPGTYHGLIMMRISSEDGANYVAPLDGGAPTRSRTRKLPFRTWWNGMFVIKDKDKKTFTRKELVLDTANKDGGAHIDPNLNEDYANLTRFGSLGWKFFRNDIEEPDFMHNPVLPSVRQIAHEVIKTLKDEFPQL